MEVKYLSLDYVKDTLIPIIQTHFARENNPAHDYVGEPEGMEQVKGCLERAQWSYIVGVIAKAVQQFLCVNKGHHFKNGNKRMSLVILLSFLAENGYDFRFERNKTELKEFLYKLFPNYTKFEDEEDFNAIEFAYYNLTIIVADSGKLEYSHDELKEKVEKFIQFTVVNPKNS